MTSVVDGAGTPAASGARQLNPRIVTVWTVEDASWSAVLVVLVVAADLGARVAGVELPWPPGLAALPVAILVGIATWKVPRARFRCWSYEVAPDALELRHGVLERVHSAIPYYRVQYVDINQGPIERALGLARLRVHTAAASSDATIPGIAADEADALRQVILERTGSGDAV
ncbi:MAG TPA: PH domain-containing protein [Actinomycetota bacterium]|nr:PH domain-containing protein [Actinomycetota bacterium]